MRTDEELEDSHMVDHARRELKLCGQWEEDPEFSETLVNAVREFARYGHSGGSHFFAVYMLGDLLCFKPLSPLTSNPDEWQDVTEFTDGSKLWQNRRDGRCFSYDQGQTWYNIEDPRFRHARHWWNFRARWWRHKINKLQDSKRGIPLPEPEVQDVTDNTN